jgi:hypothetical protein
MLLFGFGCGTMNVKTVDKEAFYRFVTRNPNLNDNGDV